MKKSGRAVTDVGNMIGETATGVVDGTTTAIGNTVAAVTATTVAPQVRGVRRAVLASLKPLLRRSLVVVPLTCAAVYGIQVALVHAVRCSPATAWMGVLVQKMIPTAVIGVAAGVLFVIRVGLPR
jgi:hypothetical protein